MTEKTEPKPAKAGRRTALAAREARLKSALKANMAKRKAQARARAEDGVPKQSDK